jgi:hypothetical protein
MAGCKGQFEKVNFSVPSSRISYAIECQNGGTSLFFISDTSDDEIVTTNPKFAIPAEVVAIISPNH